MGREDLGPLLELNGKLCSKMEQRWGVLSFGLSLEGLTLVRWELGLGLRKPSSEVEVPGQVEWNN